MLHQKQSSQQISSQSKYRRIKTGSCHTSRQPSQPPSPQQFKINQFQILFDAVPQLGIAYHNCPSTQSSTRFYENNLESRTDRNYISQTNSPSHDECFRRKITTSFFPKRELDESIESIQPESTQQHHQEISGKFSQYQKKKQIAKTFTAKDFFGSNNRLSTPSLRQVFSAQKVTKQLIIRNIQSIDIQTYIQIVENNKRSFLDEIRSINLKDPLIYFQSLLQSVVKTKNTACLILTLLLSGTLLTKFHNYKFAIYIIQQCVTLCNFNLKKFSKSKLECLILLGICSRDIKEYQFSLKFLKKALQYAWFLQDNEKEIEIYDHLGILYYYLENIKKSLHYHKRCVQAICEPYNSKVKSVSNDIIRDLFNKPSDLTNIDNLSQGILNRVHLPFISLGDTSQCMDKQGLIEQNAQRSTRQSVYREYFKSRKISLNPPTSNSLPPNLPINDISKKSIQNLQIDPRALLNEIIQFNEFQFQILTPKDQEKREVKQFIYNKYQTGQFYHPHQDVLDYNPNKLGALPLKKNKMLQYDPIKYKLTLEQKIKFREEELKEKESQDFVLTLHKFDQLNSRVLISHLSNLRGQLQSSGGMSVEDLTKIVEQEYSKLIFQLKILKN